MNELGFSVIALNAYVDEGRGVQAKEKEQALSQLSTIVSSLGAQAGFWLDPTAEAITLVDETGRICTGIELLSLTVALLMKSGQKGTIAVPVQAPSTIEQMAGAEAVPGDPHQELRPRHAGGMPLLRKSS